MRRLPGLEPFVGVHVSSCLRLFNRSSTAVRPSGRLAIDFRCERSTSDVTRFLSHLAVEGKVSASTQNQALSALVFLYKDVLDMPVGWLSSLVRAKRPLRVPVVLTKHEVRRVLARLKGRGTPALVAGVLYGTGVRLLEALRLRVKDIDFAKNEITVRGGKGDRDRVTMLPERLKGPLLRHLADVRTQHERDLAADAGWVELPGALAEKYPNAGREWAWQWVFPATRTYTAPPSGHLDRKSTRLNSSHS